MKAALLFGSSHGKTRKVVTAMLPRMAIAPDVFDVKTPPPAAALGGYELLLFAAPTYGDEELQPDMERFLAGWNPDLTGRSFVVCELGNYYGYDDFSFGALHIIRRHLLRLNAQEFCEHLSLDSFPRLNWDHLYDWVNHLNARIAGHVRR